MRFSATAKFVWLGKWAPPVATASEAFPPSASTFAAMFIRVMMSSGGMTPMSFPSESKLFWLAVRMLFSLP